ncbi:homodimeric glycerol 3-phosphate dehydrogenase (quinone) [Acinetobacter calcoaceticus]|uniref:Glycerol-3-phosphate dehydrogenase n=1 Tax=Acinetobacter calcoaceticus TaxID=471 RepID=A0A4R1XZ00_ACICA|nr:homodimeric glycerol 3-phosphate dehydrogenase (quinone) [Acinetobacter calcoaceticus]
MPQNEDSKSIYDVVIIGGGINGTGIAVDAAGRGLSVFLCEKDDLASHTSSASSKLIHGGLRYLEHKEFRLVREALAEREVLLAKAPHIIRPLRFILPHRPHLRPAWLIRTGLFFYDHLGKRETLAGSKQLKLAGVDNPLQNDIRHGFEYSDCAVDDARLVVLNAMQAREKGAKIQTRTRCIAAHREAEHWSVQLENNEGVFEVKAKALVNAAGPWVASVIRDALQLQSPYGIRLIQGSHIVVPRLFSGDKAYILQNEDQRIVFAIPYLNDYTLIGTTDREYVGDPAKVKITAEEIDYLIAICNAHFNQQIDATQIVHQFAGVRPLCDDESDNPSVITRDYTLALSIDAQQQLPLLSVFGGKLTTYRKLAEAAMQQLQAFFPSLSAAWTAQAALPGAEGLKDIDDLVIAIQQKIIDVPATTARRWATTYGTRIWNILDSASTMLELGQDFGHDLLAHEVDYVVDQEWVVQSEDLLWRRTKLGLDFSEQEIAVLDHYLTQLHQKRRQATAA